MTRTLRCLGFVALGIGCAVAFSATAVLAIGSLFVLSDWTTHWFGLPSQYGGLFLIGYLAIMVGCFAGVAACRSDARK